MFCKKCGKEVDDDSKFCRFCGTAFDKKDKPVSKKITWPIVIVVIFVGLIWISGQDSGKKASSDDTGAAATIETVKETELKTEAQTQEIAENRTEQETETEKTTEKETETEETTEKETETEETTAKETETEETTEKETETEETTEKETETEKVTEQEISENRGLEEEQADINQEAYEQYMQVLKQYQDIVEDREQGIMDYEKYPYVYLNTFDTYYMENALNLQYVIVDINQDGINEMLMSIGTGRIDCIYAYHEAEVCMPLETYSERAAISVYTDGTICLSASSGASSGAEIYYQLRSDGSLNTLLSYEYSFVNGNEVYENGQLLDISEDQLYGLLESIGQTKTEINFNWTPLVVATSNIVIP